MNNKDLATKLISLVGGKSNIISVFNCYTRARTNVKDVNKVNIDGIKSTEGVIGVVVDKNQIQIIVGPGKAVKVAQEMTAQVGETTTGASQSSDKEEFKEEYLKTKSDIRKKTNKKGTALIRKIAGIFVPIIPMFIACGLLLGIYTVCENSLKEQFTKSTFGIVFNVVSSSVFTVLNVIVGYNACKEFGGDGIIGAALAGALTNPLMNGADGEGIWMGFYTFKTAEVGIFTILLVAIGTAYLEKLIRKFMPDIIDAFMTPLLTVIIMASAAFFVLQPIGAAINMGLAEMFKGIIKHCAWLLGIVPMFYLLLVLTGTHHSLMAVSAALIGPGKGAIGYTPLVPVQLMAGAAEVGAALYILMISKNKKLKKNIIGSLPIGFLGIDEPLIWGMSVPLKRPFIAAGLGGFVGGTMLAVMNITANVPESTGIEAALVCNKPWVFVAAFMISIVAGFIFQFFIGFKDTIEVKDPNTGEVKEEVIETSYAIKLYQKYRAKHPKKAKVGAK